MLSFAWGCSRGERGDAAEHKKDPTKESGGLITVLKGRTLADFKMKTIGSAFDSYVFFTKKEWKQTPMQGGQFAIHYTGWVDPATLDDQDGKAGITGKGVDVMFIIDATGAYYVFMVSRVESRSDGKQYAYPVGSSKDILAAIYANRKIDF